MHKNFRNEIGLARGNPCAIMETRTKETVIRGYYVYKTIWNAIVGERLECRRDRDNEKDRYAVGVFQNEVHVLFDHLPKNTCGFVLYVLIKEGK